jgi:hypothetical protein
LTIDGLMVTEDVSCSNLSFQRVSIHIFPVRSLNAFTFAPHRL